MQCPRCKTQLNTVTLDGLELDVCRSCHGAWFDSDELRQAKDLSLPEANWLDFDIWAHEGRFKVDSADLACPRCARRLCHLNYADTAVQIDACSHCRGVWVDGGELKQIVSALDAEINAKPFREYVLSAIHEAVELLNGPEPLASEWQDLKQVISLLCLRLFVERPGLYAKMQAVQRSLPQ